ncbi:MAG: YabP/YqfC family sporulation protein [Bacilli bacterium]
MLKTIKNYIYDKDFRILIINNQLNINNYKQVKTIDSSFIEIEYDNKLLTVRGRNLVLTKILNDELLIEGIINKIEMG